MSRSWKVEKGGEAFFSVSLKEASHQSSAEQRSVQHLASGRKRRKQLSVLLNTTFLSIICGNNGCGTVRVRWMGP